ncbi:restriction endonuclease subunit S [Glaesserella parasuis]|nr:restriction endonuclease subunit S [Glaesserella parasuis]MDP0403467.1 restriction endonuclease subunit S [Glaesserella parasuis]MDP0451475.1 restriction endonuclease subunit S [Glaesserella parasuis]MDP0469066.1 restriction endonuclease subunit S [Glaesserella parasuis]MDP0478077.1 restriction endonuclease subunit S [Glaesserella parasuis]
MNASEQNKPNQQERVIPKLRFPEFQTALGWKRHQLSEYSKIVRGGSPRPIEKYLTQDKEGLNWLKIGDVEKDAKYVIKTAEKVSLSALSKTREVNEGDFILSNSMSFGRPYILKIKTCIHDGWIAITNIDIKLDKNYLYYLMLTSSCQNYFFKNAAGSSVLNLNAEIIKSLPISLPEISEQQKIADCLSSLDELIELQEQKLATLKQHKKGLMQQLFPSHHALQAGRVVYPKLRFPQFRNCKGWEVVELKVLANRVTVKNKDNAIIRVLTNSANDGVIDQGDYFDRDIANKNNLDGYYIIEFGDYVYNPRISNLAPVGPISKNKVGIGVMSPLYTVFRFKNEQNDFYEYFFKTNTWHKYLQQNSNSGARYDRMNITNNDFMSMPLPMLIPKEQQAIADCLSSLDNLINEQNERIGRLKTHKKGLMQQLFPNI